MTEPDNEPAAPFLTTFQLAERWQIRRQLLANWRHKGIGPNYYRIGTLVRYPIAEVERWEESQFTRHDIHAAE